MTMGVVCVSAARPQPLQDLPAIHVRQHKVQDDQLWAEFLANSAPLPLVAPTTLRLCPAA